jgi:hypothetical protein
MGEVQIDFSKKELLITSHLIFYGNAANVALAEQLRDEIETMWNEPYGVLHLGDGVVTVRFKITAEVQTGITDLEVYQNLDGRNNYFRIEAYAIGNISFVDGVGCNSGYFLLENLYRSSTTAAHEYGHTIGLDHPPQLDIRGKGVPGIMYPRGTLVDPPFQYDPTKPAGVTGGTMHPMHRRVQWNDIVALRLHKLKFENGRALLGGFTNIYHWDHAAQL